MHDRYLETFIWARNETLKDIFEFINSIKGASKYQSFFKMSRKILISFLFLYIKKQPPSIYVRFPFSIIFMNTYVIIEMNQICVTSEEYISFLHNLYYIRFEILII